MTDYIEARFPISTARAVSDKQLCDDATDDEAVFLYAVLLLKHKGHALIRARYVYDARHCGGETIYSEFYAIPKDDWLEHFSEGKDGYYYYHS